MLDYIPTRLEKISGVADHRWTYKIRENKAGKTAVGREEQAGVVPNSYCHAFQSRSIT
jgi:hypothetical protein